MEKSRLSSTPGGPGAAAPLGLADWLHFLKANYTALAVGAAVIVLVVAGLVMYLWQQRRNELRASQMLLMVQTPQQWQELLTQYPKATTAPIALLALAANQYSAGAYDQALESYRQFQEKYPRHSLTLAAELGVIQCQEGQGQIESAFNAYAQFAFVHPNHFLTPQALFGQARCLQLMRRHHEARAIYEDFIVQHPKSEWVAQAEFALRLLEREIRAQSARTPTNAPPGNKP